MNKENKNNLENTALTI